MNFEPVDYDPFIPLGPVPTTEPQREIIANVLIGGDAANCSYNESVSLTLKGSFDYELYTDAVLLLVARHQALRTKFSNDGLEQTFTQVAETKVDLIDISKLSPKEQHEEVNRRLVSEAETPFDLENGPLYRFSVIRYSEIHHQLILSFHHVICDGWSLGILMQDLGRFYSDLVQGKPFVESPATGFSKFAEEELVYSGSEENRIVENYWLSKFKNNIPSFEFPSDKPRPSKRSYRANRIDVEVPSETIDGIRKTGAKFGTSYVTILTAAFQVFLHRVTSQDDIVLGLPASGQSATGYNDLVGHCVNVLPIRTTVDSGKSFVDFLKTQKTALLDAYDHQRFTFGSLIRKLNILRFPNRIPLVPVAFNLDIGITDGVSFAGCEFEFSTNPRHYENFEIFINATGSGSKLILECTHNTDLYDSELMQLRMEEFIVLLKGIADNPESKIYELPLITEKEQELIFKKWNSIENDFRTTKTLISWFEKTATTYPDAIALSYENQHTTYSELDSRANQLANWMLGNDVRPGSFIGVFTYRNRDLIVSILGILKCGCAYVPIDPNYPLERVSYILEDAKCALVLVSEGLQENVGSWAHSYCIDTEWDKGPGMQTDEHPGIETNPGDLAYIIYTSGSTGKPKGSLIGHSKATRLFTATDSWYGFNERDVWTLFHSAAFDFSVWEIWGALLYGGRLVIVSYNISRDPRSFYELLKKEKVTVLNQTPSAFMALLNEDAAISEPENRVNSLRYVIFGGEALELEGLRPWFEHHGDKNPQLINMYGITETTVHVTYRPISLDDLGKGQGSMIGVPIPDLQVYILDQYQQPVGIGIAGELYVGGAGVGRGYLNRPELTAQRFIHNEYNPFSENALYRSGDLAKYSLQGDIEYLGRIDTQVKIRGFRIELGEIEAILKKHPDVKQQVVMAREDVPGEKRLVAYLILKEGVRFDLTGMREFLMVDLPEYMVPSAFVLLDKIPVTGNGKIDRKALPKPEITLTPSGHYEEPYTPTEEMLATIWCDVLGIEKVGRKDNFFELGGHSLIGVRVFNEVEKQLGIRIQLSVLFSAPTIEELARVISRSESLKPWSCLVPLQPKGNLPPLFCIHMHNGNIHRWRVLIKHLGTNRPLYAIQPRGLDEKQQPHTTIEEMATYYIGVMKEAQPYGPYNLMGLCFSGMVVYEMATQLQAMGEEVAFLGMINNYAPPENPTLFKVKTELNKFLKMDISEKVNYVKEKQQKITKLFSGDKTAITEMQIDMPEKTHLGHDLRTIHSLALLHYSPQKHFKGKLALFRNNEPIEAFYNDKLGWDRLVQGEITCDVIDGCDNDTIITDEPYNIELSLLIKHRLDAFDS
ncbi:MAG TPA: amino acid adenylation domain-containing protein [Bacteroidia bacterium]|nr:amino acid adenylation domain-containing protein [Bacteroidia bacterium]